MASQPTIVTGRRRPPFAAAEDPMLPAGRLPPWAMLFRCGCPIQGATGCFSRPEHTSDEENDR